ncbi:retrotransposon protein, putative, ty1-copia subclass [Tanacetum coccineum]
MELYGLLQTAEQGIKKSGVPSTLTAPVLIVGHNAKKRKTSHSNWKGKATQGKSDRGCNRKVKSEIAPTSDLKEAVCFYYNTKGHWKRSCLKYLKDLKDKGCGTHICAVLQGLKKSRRLKHGELNLFMGNRKIIHVTRIGKYELMLKSGDGYQFSFDNENGDILVYSNGCFMFKASPCKGIYETVECISNNGNVILNVGSSNELDKSKLWHSRLGYVNKKRIAQLQEDGVLESFEFKSDDVCESCILSKMTKSPFTGTCERGEGLLDFVHTDSDTFEVFKRYQNEVENQLGRKIKGYALETDAHILNLVSTKKVSKTPFEMWKGKRPSLGHIKIWGCEVFVRREAQDKLEARSEKCLFVEDSGSKIDLEEIQEYADKEPIVNTDTQQEVVTPVEPDDISLPIRRTTSRVSKPSQDPQFYYRFHIEEDKISDSTLTKLNEPANYKEVMASPEASKWKEAIKSEIQSMYDNQVWNLVDTTPSLKTVGCKWIFKKKTGMDGKVHTYKSRSEDESSIYVKVSGSVIVFVVLYVDDILLIGNDIPTLQSVKDWLGKCFAMKDLGDAAYILSIKIYKDRTKRLIGLSHDKYLDKILKRFIMENSKKENLPLHNGIKISKDLCLKTDDELDKMSRIPYASAIGSIMYAMTCTRPDVSFALSMASKEAIWMKNFIGDLGVVPTVQDPIEILCDYESAVALTKEPKDHGKSKHIERKYHFVRSKVEGHVIMKDIRSKDNPADPFTKALAKSKHDEHAKSIAVALNVTLYLVDQDRVRPIIVDGLSKWETIEFSV